MLVGAVVLLLLAQVVVALDLGLVGVVTGMLLFFLAFNYLEASLPSLVSRLATREQPGGRHGRFFDLPVSWGGAGWQSWPGWCTSWAGDAGLLLLVSLMTALWIWLAARDVREPAGGRAENDVAHGYGTE